MAPVNLPVSLHVSQIALLRAKSYVLVQAQCKHTLICANIIYRQKEQQLLEQVQELRSSAESRERELSSQLEAALAQQQQQGADTTVTDLMQQIQQVSSCRSLTHPPHNNMQMRVLNGVALCALCATLVHHTHMFIHLSD